MNDIAAATKQVNKFVLDTAQSLKYNDLVTSGTLPPDIVHNNNNV